MVVYVHTLPGYDDILPIYGISDKGKVYSKSRAKKGKALKQRENTNGYCLVSLKKRSGGYFNALVHRLVALAFVPGYREDLQVDHRDGNKKRNIPSNLKWATPKENTRNPKTFKKFVKRNRISHSSKKFEVINTVTGEVTVYPSGCAAARAIGYKSNSFCISASKGYRSVGKHIIREAVNYEL